MPAWRAGPFAFDLAVDAPHDWSCAPGAARTFRVEAADARAARREQRVLDLAVTVAAERVHVERSGGFTADIDYDTSSARYRGLIDVRADGQCPVLESFLRIATAGALLRSGGALLHASSVSRHSRAFVFCGLSSAGKTTLVAGTDDDTYLGDDQAIITAALGNDAEPTTLLAWGSPFAGSARRRAPPVARRVAAFVLLDATQRATTRLTRRHDRAAAAAELMRHVCSHEQTRAEAVRALGFVDRVLATTPVFSLARHIDTGLASILDDIERALAKIERGGPAPPVVGGRELPPADGTANAAPAMFD